MVSTTSQPPFGGNPAPGFVNHPEHRVDLSPFAGTVTVSADGQMIARSQSAILVEETNHAPVYYLPVEDIEQSHLERSSRVTRCPFKGKATHWNVTVGLHGIDNAMWAYEMPYDEMLELAGMAAFYANKVDIKVEPAS